MRTMTEPRRATPTVTFVDDYCQRCRHLFTDETSPSRQLGERYILH
jgi:hypothetical protein